MKSKNIIFITVLSLLIVSVSVTMYFFIKDIKKDEHTDLNNADPPSMFAIEELNLALFKTNIRLPIDEGYTFTFEYDSNYLFMEDGYVCPFNTGSTYIFVKATHNSQTFLHTIAISIFEITTPTITLINHNDNTFSISITSCPALSVAEITTSKQLTSNGEIVKQGSTYTQPFKLDNLSETFSLTYSINLDNFSQTYTQQLTAEQEYVASLTHKDLHIIDNNFVNEANENNIYNESEFVLTKDYNLPNFSSCLIVENPSIVSFDNNKLTPLMAGSTKVYVLLNEEEIFSETITVSVVEAEQITVEENQNVGTPFNLNITPCYASTLIKYDSLYLTYKDNAFLPTRTGTTTLTIYSGSKTILKQINISFSQSSAEKLTSTDKTILSYTRNESVNTWFTLKVINTANSEFAQNQTFTIYVNTTCYTSNFDFAPSYDFYFTEKGSYYIVFMTNESVYCIYNIIVE